MKNVFNDFNGNNISYTMFERKKYLKKAIQNHIWSQKM